MELKIQRKAGKEEKLYKEQMRQIEKKEQMTDLI